MDFLGLDTFPSHDDTNGQEGSKKIKKCSFEYICLFSVAVFMMFFTLSGIGYLLYHVIAKLPGILAAQEAEAERLKNGLAKDQLIIDSLNHTIAEDENLIKNLDVVVVQLNETVKEDHKYLTLVEKEVKQLSKETKNISQVIHNVKEDVEIGKKRNKEIMKSINKVNGTLGNQIDSIKAKSAKQKKQKEKRFKELRNIFEDINKPLGYCQASPIWACFLVINVGENKQNWTAAQKDCKEKGGVLAEPKDVASLSDWAKAVKTLDDPKECTYWLGAKRSEITGNITWVSHPFTSVQTIKLDDGGKLQYLPTYWNDEQTPEVGEDDCLGLKYTESTPSKGTGGEPNREFVMVTEKCETSFLYICQFSADP